MRYAASLLLLAGLFVVLAGGCSDKKKADLPSGQAPPAPAGGVKGKPPPRAAEN